MFPPSQQLARKTHTKNFANSVTSSYSTKCSSFSQSVLRGRYWWCRAPAKTVTPVWSVFHTKWCQIPLQLRGAPALVCGSILACLHQMCSSIYPDNQMQSTCPAHEIAASKRYSQKQTSPRVSYFPWRRLTNVPKVNMVRSEPKPGIKLPSCTCRGWKMILSSSCLGSFFLFSWSIRQANRTGYDGQADIVIALLVFGHICPILILAPAIL